MTDMPPIPPPGPGSGGGVGIPAPIGSRLVARLIDWLVGLALILPVLVVGLILLAVSDILGLLVLVLGYLAVIAVFFYIFGWGLGETGQTPGKRSQGVRLVDANNGMPIGGGKGIGRLFLEGIINSICYISWIWALFDDRNTTIHDKVLTAEVVQAPKGEIMPIFPNGRPF